MRGLEGHECRRSRSQSDLLRSLIFMRAEKEKQDRDEIFDEYWSKFETAFWSEEVKRAGRPLARLDLALRFFLIAKTRTIGQMRSNTRRAKKTPHAAGSFLQT
jgi:uncharacterized protein with ParB-like and HNH nuclease domain